MDARPLGTFGHDGSVLTLALSGEKLMTVTDLRNLGLSFRPKRREAVASPEILSDGFVKHADKDFSLTYVRSK
jgi:hypothetical protein